MDWKTNWTHSTRCHLCAPTVLLSKIKYVPVISFFSTFRQFGFFRRKQPVKTLTQPRAGWKDMELIKGKLQVPWCSSNENFLFQKTSADVQFLQLVKMGLILSEKSQNSSTKHLISTYFYPFIQGVGFVGDIWRPKREVQVDIKMSFPY